MQRLASFVMRGRSQAVMATSVLAMLSMVMPPLSLLSSAIVALVTLREGRSSGLQVIGFSLLACVVLSTIALGNPAPAIGLALLLWFPMWVLGQMLREMRSLSMVLQSALVFGLLTIGYLYLESGDPIADWQAIFATLADSFTDAGLYKKVESQQLIEELARWMTGFFAASYYLQLVASLLLARWWQSLLYNLGGFQQEFHQLRLSKLLAYLGAALGLLSLLQLDAGGNLLRYLTILLMAAYFIQGLAVAHGTVKLLSLNRAWLIGVYIMLVITGPQMLIMISMLGLADIWIDFRAKAASKMNIGD
ncbi:MAG: YybS family protein [Candidatus Polarisedimenticolaceae bacterium]|nr:YybS family protein [Candidatus Polarisedimenticolaceae bacterium]